MGNSKHNPNFSKVLILEIWIAAQVAGYRLVWSPALRAVVLRPLEGRDHD